MTTTLTRSDDFVLTQLVGPNALQALEAAGLPAPEGEQRAIAHDAGFVACIGEDQYLIAADKTPPFETSAPPWCFSRSDGVLRLGGTDVFDVLAEFCAGEVAPLTEGGWLMTRLAGINVWLYRAASEAATNRHEHHDLLIGCDASYERYLHDTLEDAVQRPFTVHA